MANKFYHYIEYRRPAQNIEGSQLVSKVIPCDAETLDEAARDRKDVTTLFGANRIVSLTTHNVGMGPGVSK